MPKLICKQTIEQKEKLEKWCNQLEKDWKKLGYKKRYIHSLYGMGK